MRIKLLRKTKPPHRTTMKETSVKEASIKKITTKEITTKGTSMKVTTMKVTTMKEKQHIGKIELMHKRVVISPNSAVGRSIKTAPTITNQNSKLESVFGFQPQAETLKLISLKALLPLGLMQFNRFYLT